MQSCRLFEGNLTGICSAFVANPPKYLNNSSVFEGCPKYLQYIAALFRKTISDLLDTTLLPLAAPSVTRHTICRIHLAKSASPALLCAWLGAPAQELALARGSSYDTGLKYRNMLWNDLTMILFRLCCQ